MTRLKTLIFTFISLFFIACGNDSVAPTTSAKDTSYETAQKTTQNEILKAINKARSVARDCHDGMV